MDDAWEPIDPNALPYVSPYAGQQLAGPTTTFGGWPQTTPLQPAGPPPPVGSGRSRRKTIVVTSIVAAAVVVVAVVAVLVVHISSSSPRVTMPTSFAGYTKIDNSTSRQVTSSLRDLGSGNSTTSEIFDAAAIGVYSRDTGDLPGLLALALPTSRIPAQAGNSSADIAAELLGGALPTDQTITVAPGPHGGAVRCGTSSAEGDTLSVCGWSDHRTSGLLVSIRPSLGPTALAAVENVFRDRIE